jgi:hypothetical protein
MKKHYSSAINAIIFIEVEVFLVRDQHIQMKDFVIYMDILHISRYNISEFVCLLQNFHYILNKCNWHTRCKH